MFCRNLMDVDVGEIADELRSQDVVEVKRIMKTQNGMEESTPSLILTFNLPVSPENIKIGYLSIRVRPFIPNPRRCFNCQGYGHTTTSCSKIEVCGRCAKEGHRDANCQEHEKCANCSGSHTARSRDCPVFKKAKAILRISTEQKLFFPATRREYKKKTINSRNLVKPDVSFATATSKQVTTNLNNQPSGSYNELKNLFRCYLIKLHPIS
ncbi:uncharacterized protein LOC142331697 [Lycorma delicatula]|uniref:uncharacterized protein LOC142331697 n=1 Tax=Lycorma delicatula TaxID=130591 RepID=UPI003F51233F